MASAFKSLDDYPAGVQFIEQFTEEELLEFCENFKLPYLEINDLNELRYPRLDCQVLCHKRKRHTISNSIVLFGVL
jgi:hypothetical protein